MKGLKRAAILTALAIPPLAAHAQFKPLSESAMRATTGQGGLTIEMQTELNINQIKYTDQGSINLNSLHLSGANGTSPLDNMTWTIDVAGANEVLTSGFSKAAEMGANGISTSDPNVAWAMAQYDQGGGVYGRKFNDGDLVIHLGPTDPAAFTSLSNYENAIDFGLTLQQVNTQGAGAYASNVTPMFSNINMQGYLGPTDIILHNGDGTQTTLPGGIKVSNKYIEVDSNFKVTNMDLNWDAGDVILLFNFADIQIKGMTITNTTGNDTVGHFGYADFKTNIGTATSPSGHTGLGFYNTEFRADINMPQFIVGGKSIGSVQFNDFVIQNTNLVVYGH